MWDIVDQHAELYVLGINKYKSTIKIGVNCVTLDDISEDSDIPSSIRKWWEESDGISDISDIPSSVTQFTLILIIDLHLLIPKTYNLACWSTISQKY